ncbi:MAG: DUF4974 domain-containing protein [Flavobacteriaceae bacterium]|nr:DUF4974 domain-containing protein [Flavobacteriaceae bacterium]
MKYLKNKQAKSLMEKYLNGKCTVEEKKLVESYLDSFQGDTGRNADIDFKLDIEQQLWEKIKAKTLQTKKTKVLPLVYRNMMKYAAVFIGAGFLLFWGYNAYKTDQDILNADKKEIVLQTGQDQKSIDEHTVDEIVDESGNVIASIQNGILQYRQNTKNGDFAFNEVIVPSGKTFQIVLADGTLVHLNAGSHFRFPVGFHPSKGREVYLSGEGYFEVAKDDSSPFVVQANDMEVTVLGTHFNVSAYLGEPQHTVLVEGSVSVNNQKTDSHEIIKPGQKAVIKGNGMVVNTVDVKDYTGWTQNVLTFRDELFPNIIKKIERRYNVTIVNNYPELDNARFNGKFKNESILSLMNTFKESANFEYKIEKGKIVINKKTSL